jgi:hypothetical protein
MDSDTGEDRPGGGLVVFPCASRWTQYVSFGNGTIAPQGSIHITIPKHIVEGLRLKGHEQEARMCIGVYGRGDADEEHKKEEYEETSITGDEKEDGTGGDKELSEGQLQPLRRYQGRKLVTTKCSNTGAIIEWLFVPFIVENEEVQTNQTKEGTEVPNNESTEEPANEEL